MDYKPHYKDGNDRNQPNDRRCIWVPISNVNYEVCNGNTRLNESGYCQKNPNRLCKKLFVRFNYFFHGQLPFRYGHLIIIIFHYIISLSTIGEQLIIRGPSFLIIIDAAYPVKNQKIFLSVYPDRPSSAGDRASRLWNQKFAADRLIYSDDVCYNHGRQAKERNSSDLNWIVDLEKLLRREKRRNLLCANQTALPF